MAEELRLGSIVKERGSITRIKGQLEDIPEEPCAHFSVRPSLECNHLAIPLLALFLIFLASPAAGYEEEINKISASIGAKIEAAGKTLIAVVDFTDLNGNVTELGRFLAEEFSVALASAGRGFRVVDRTHLKSLLVEHQLSSTGLIDPTTAKELGRIAGVEALLTGTITPFGDSVRIATKLLDVETAEIIDASRGNIPRTQAIAELLRTEIRQPGSPASSLGGPSATNRPATQTQQTVEENGFRFELLDCARAGQGVRCVFLMTRLEEDARFRFFRPGSRVIDYSGNEYVANSVEIGSKRNKDFVNGDFVRGVPMRGAISFADIPASVTDLALLELRYGFPGDFTVQLRDVSVSN